MFCIAVTSLVNKSLTSSGKFPSNHKLADITRFIKKKDPQAKENYRPVSVLPVLSKVFERLMQKQINSFITDHLSDFLCGYRQAEADLGLPQHPRWNAF